MFQLWFQDLVLFTTGRMLTYDTGYILSNLPYVSLTFVRRWLS